MTIERHLEFLPAELPARTKDLRLRVRAFLSRELEGYSPVMRSNSWMSVDRDFSQKMGREGLLGLALPQEYGGGGLSNIERYVVAEEALYAGAPVGFHWIAERQSAPLILRYGSETQKKELIPAICAGKICCCIGMSEPNSGSDLASLQSRARKTAAGWVLSGSKIWTTAAHEADYMIGLFRTESGGESKHAGLSQFLIGLKDAPGITIRPILDLTGARHFNEVVFDDAVVPPEALLGGEGQGWKQVNEELSYERSGPERFMSCMMLFSELLACLSENSESDVKTEVGRILGDLITLRNMSISVTTRLDQGEDVSLQAAMVKDMGADFEQGLPARVQSLLDIEPSLTESSGSMANVLGNLTMMAPSFSLRGGTVEILRGIIAKRLTAA